MTRNDLTTAPIAALRTFLKGADAYSGHSKDNAADLRAHALATFDAAQPAAVVVAPVAPVAAPVVDAPAVDAAPALKRVMPSTRFPFAAVVTLTAAHVAALGLDIAPGTTVALRRAGSTDRCQWYIDNEGKRFDAAVIADATVATIPADGFVAMPRTTSKTAQARTGRKVSPRLIGKLAALLATAGLAATDGSMTLTADQLVQAGLGKSWATSPNVAALAACGYTGTATRGALVLTPAAVAAQVAA
jgi:hypothetical protein